METPLVRWSAVAEIASSVAVLLTLVYLAVQTRQLIIQNEQIAVQTEQNTLALQVNARQAAANAEIDWLYTLLNTPEALIKRGPVSLEGEYDAGVLDATGVMFSALFRLRENLWLQYQSGALDKELWEPYQNLLVELLTTNEIARASWTENRQFYAPGFVDAINGLVQERERADGQ